MVKEIVRVEMVDELISFWQVELGDWRFLFKHMKSGLALFILFCVSAMVILILSPFRSLSLNFLATLILEGAGSWILESQSRRVLLKKYKIRRTHFFDGHMKVKLFKKDLFAKELDRRSLLSKDVLNELAQLIRQKQSDAKLNFIRVGSLAVAMTLLGTQVLSWVFTHEVKDWASCMRTGLHLAFLFVLSWIIGIKVANAAGGILNSRYFQLKGMTECIEEIRFELGIRIHRDASRGE